MLLRYSLQLKPKRAPIEAAVVAAPSSRARCRPISPARARRAVTTRAAADAVLAATLARALQTGGKIRHQIRGILDPDRHPQQARSDAGAQPRRLLHAGMSHAGRMRDQALDAAQRLGQREALEPGRATPRPPARRPPVRSSAWRRSRSAGAARSRARDDRAGPGSTRVRPPDARPGTPPPRRYSPRARACAHAACARRASVMKAVEGRAGDADGVRPPGQILVQLRASPRSPRRRPRRCGRSGTWWSNA